MLLDWSYGPCLTRSSDWLMLKVPRAQSELGKTAFSVNAPTSWNNLQQTLRIGHLISFGQFKALISGLPESVCNCF